MSHIGNIGVTQENIFFFLGIAVERKETFHILLYYFNLLNITSSRNFYQPGLLTSWLVRSPIEMGLTCRGIKLNVVIFLVSEEIAL